MKNALYLLVIFAALSLAGCSSDDDNGGGGHADSWMTAKIDGTEYYFENFTVEKEVFADYTDLHIVGYMVDMPTHWIEIVVEEGATGPDASWRFVYYLDGEAFEKEAGFQTEITENTESTISGTFSGTVLLHDGTGEPIEMSDGEFSVKR